MTRRWPALLAIPALLVVALLADQGTDGAARDEASAQAEATSARRRMMPTAAGDDALTSTWYCAGGTAEEDGAANQTVVVYNPTDRPTTGSITAYPSEGKPETVRKEVPARGQVRVELVELVSAPYASALVEFRGGEIVVEHVVRGPNGVDAGPCASSASDEWHFAAGATTLDAADVLVLFNPFPEPATVDIALALDGGLRRTPGSLRGLQVPARSVVAAPVTVDPQPQVSATVVARAGRIIADRIQTYSGRGAGNTEEEVEAEAFKPKGLAVTLGVPTPAHTWMFPFGGKAEGLHERFVVYNPGDDQAEVEVAVTLSDPGKNGEVDPFAVTVNPRSWAVVDLDEEDRDPDPGRPRGRGHLPQRRAGRRRAGALHDRAARLVRRRHLSRVAADLGPVDLRGRRRRWRASSRSGSRWPTPAARRSRCSSARSSTARCGPSARRPPSPCAHGSTGRSA